MADPGRKLIQPYNDFCCHRITYFDSSKDKNQRATSSCLRGYLTQQWLSEVFLARQLQGVRWGKQNGRLGHPVLRLQPVLRSMGPYCIEATQKPTSGIHNLNPSMVNPRARLRCCQTQQHLAYPRRQPDNSLGLARMGGPGANARNKMQALTRLSKQEGGAWLKLVKNETTVFSLLVSSFSLKQSNSVKQNFEFKNLTFFRTLLWLSDYTSRSAVWEKHSVRDRTCWRGLFWKIHRSLRGNGPNVRTDAVESNIERTQSCYKNSVICLTKCASPPQFHDWQEC